jgi:hypothetical protein
VLRRGISLSLGSLQVGRGILAEVSFENILGLGQGETEDTSPFSAEHN